MNKTLLKMTRLPLFSNSGYVTRFSPHTVLRDVEGGIVWNPDPEATALYAAASGSVFRAKKGKGEVGRAWA